jgi:hypothetical protein
VVSKSTTQPISSVVTAMAPKGFCCPRLIKAAVTPGLTDPFRAGRHECQPLFPGAPTRRANDGPGLATRTKGRSVPMTDFPIARICAALALACPSQHKEMKPCLCLSNILIGRRPGGLRST